MALILKVNFKRVRLAFSTIRLLIQNQGLLWEVIYKVRALTCALDSVSTRRLAPRLISPSSKYVKMFTIPMITNNLLIVKTCYSDPPFCPLMDSFQSEEVIKRSVQKRQYANTLVPISRLSDDVMSYIFIILQFQKDTSDSLPCPTPRSSRYIAQVCVR